MCLNPNLHESVKENIPHLIIQFDNAKHIWLVCTNKVGLKAPECKGLFQLVNCSV